VLINFERIAVEPIQAVHGAEPEEPVFVLGDTVNAVLGEPLAAGKMFKFYIGVMGLQRKRE
jgi:hypothetical protein